MDSDLESLLTVQSVDEVTRIVKRIAERFYMQRFSILEVQDNPSGEPTFHSYHNVPQEFFDEAFDMDAAKLCPVMQHAKTSHLPLVWDRKIYKRTDKDSLWTSQADFGYRSGVITALHLPSGRHLALGFDGDAPNVGNEAAQTHVAGFLQLTVNYVEAALGKLQRERAVREHPLTPRELECLKWTMEGKTAWETGRILSISERTVNLHLGNVMKTLNASTKMLAAVRALQLGLLDY